LRSYRVSETTQAIRLASSALFREGPQYVGYGNVAPFSQDGEARSSQQPARGKAGAFGQSPQAALQRLYKGDNDEIYGHANLFLLAGFEWQCFIDEHDGDAVPNGIKEAAGITGKPFRGSGHGKVALAFRATEDLE